MLTLNLLPEQYKAEYTFEKRKRFAVSLCISLGVIIAIFNALLLSVYIFLNIHERSLAEALATQKSTEAIRNITALEDEIRAVNAKIHTITAAQREIVQVAPILEKITALILPRMYVKNISIDVETKRVTMTGFAETRELVLELATRLSASDAVEPQSVQNPVKNILKEKEIDFTFAFQLRGERTQP